MTRPSQQEFLRAAKIELGLEWDELAERAGIVPRTFKNYRLPDDSGNHRTMPELAWRAIQDLLDKHRRSQKRAAKKNA